MNRKKLVTSAAQCSHIAGVGHHQVCNCVCAGGRWFSAWGEPFSLTTCPGWLHPTQRPRNAHPGGVRPCSQIPWYQVIWPSVCWVAVKTSITNTNIVFVVEMLCHVKVKLNKHYIAWKHCLHLHVLLFHQWGACFCPAGRPWWCLQGRQRGRAGPAGAERSSSTGRISTHLHWHPGAAIHDGLLSAHSQVCMTWRTKTHENQIGPDPQMDYRSPQLLHTLTKSVFLPLIIYPRSKDQAPCSFLSSSPLILYWELPSTSTTVWSSLRVQVLSEDHLHLLLTKCLSCFMPDFTHLSESMSHWFGNKKCLNALKYLLVKQFIHSFKKSDTRSAKK